MHAVARRVGELFLHHFERGARCRASAREIGKRANATRSGAGPGARQLTSACAQRTTGGDRRDEVAQAVGPRRLHLAQPQWRDAGRSTRAGATPTATAGRVRRAAVPVDEPPRDERDHRRAAIDAAQNCSGRERTPACVSHSCCAAHRPDAARRQRATRGVMTGECAGGEIAEDPDTASAARSVIAATPAATIARACAPPWHARRAARRGATAGRRSTPVARPIAIAHEQRLDREVVAQRRDDRGDLHDLASERPGVAADEVVAVEVHDDIERRREDLAHDALGDVLARHQRGVDERVERLGRAVRVHGAQEPAPGVDRPAELERLGAAHLADDDAVGPHRQHELHEVAQADLAGAVERRRAHLVVGAVGDRHRELADLLTASGRSGSAAPPPAARRRAWSCPRRALRRPPPGCGSASAPRGTRPLRLARASRERRGRRA